MSVAVVVSCDGEGCGRHFEVDVSAGSTELVDLSAGGAGLWLEVLLGDLPDGWTATGSIYEFRAWCAEHEGVGAT